MFVEGRGSPLLGLGLKKTEKPHTLEQWGRPRGEAPRPILPPSPVEEARTREAHLEPKYPACDPM